MPGITDALRDAIRNLQEIVFQETGQAGQLVALTIGRDLGKTLGLYPGSSIILRGAPADLRVTVESEALDVPLANRVAVLERAVATFAPPLRETRLLNALRAAAVAGDKDAIGMIKEIEGAM